MKNPKSYIAYVATFPPRECGIATFTADLTNAFDGLFAPRIESKIIAMNQNEITKYYYGNKVIFQIAQNNKNDYLECAKKINADKKIKLIHVEHEFGIFGENFGANLLSFLKEVKKPIVITFHTVLPNPVPEMKKVVEEINDYTRLIFVMTKLSKHILTTDYNISTDKIKIVPHGIHPSSYAPSQKTKKILKLQEKIVLSTFGMIGPGKGIEYALEALPAVIKKYPNIVYLIVGATHPVVLQTEGEKYRNSLIQKVKELNIQNNVIFYNEYFKYEKLLQFLQATDIYLSLSLNPDQAVSGTLSYALGSGRPAISTAFAQAKEDVTEEVGYLVGFQDSKQIEEALIKMIEQPKIMEQMSKNAYFRTRNMVWQNVALSYMREIINVLPELNTQEKNVPNLKLTHLNKMTDKFGLLQFAELTEPNPKFGYTLDDNARALIAVIDFFKENHDILSLKLAKIYLKFIEYVFNDKNFSNYINYDKTFNTELNSKENLEDAHTRGLLALSHTAATKEIPEELKDRAITLFKIGQQKINGQIISPRAVAFYIKALCKWLMIENNQTIKNEISKNCEYLIELYKINNTPGWQWFEDILAYSNGVIPEALLSAYQAIGDQRYFNIAKTTSDFLFSHSFQDGICTPIGQEKWYRKGSERAYFDQQPEEVTSLVLLSNTMYEITQDFHYRELTISAFNWFLGNNLLGQVVYDQETGGCYDGVQEKNINLNQGAESTVSYLIARLII